MAATACPSIKDKKAAPKRFPKTGKRGAPQAFAYILYSILENEPVEIASWSEDGKSFSVHDGDRWANLVLQKYFRHTNQSSFQRQLNLYGFRKVKKGPNRGAYEHLSFLRGRRDLLGNVKRPRQMSGKRCKGGRGPTRAAGPVGKPRSSSESSTESPSEFASDHFDEDESPLPSPEGNAGGAADLLTAASLADDAFIVASLCRVVSDPGSASSSVSARRRKESMDGAYVVASLYRGSSSLGSTRSESTSSEASEAEGTLVTLRRVESVQGALDGLVGLCKQTAPSMHP